MLTTITELLRVKHQNYYLQLAALRLIITGDVDDVEQYLPAIDLPPEQSFDVEEASMTGSSPGEAGGAKRHESRPEGGACMIIGCVDNIILPQETEIIPICSRHLSLLQLLVRKQLSSPTPRHYLFWLMMEARMRKATPLDRVEHIRQLQHNRRHLGAIIDACRMGDQEKLASATSWTPLLTPTSVAALTLASMPPRGRKSPRHSSPHSAFGAYVRPPLRFVSLPLHELRPCDETTRSLPLALPAVATTPHPLPEAPPQLPPMICRDDAGQAALATQQAFARYFHMLGARASVEDNLSQASANINRVAYNNMNDRVAALKWALGIRQ
jgi:hypothetical protein